VEVVAKASLQENIDYLDIHYPQQRVAVLKNLAEQIKAQGRCFITQAGFNPGLPSVLVLLAKSHFTRYEKARVGVAMNTRF
jgi:saccharopine dehydrogenase (NAD+, L-lysine-forming)